MNRSLPWRQSEYILLAGFVLLGATYFFWTASDVLGDLGGDSAMYLLMARHYSPWSAPSDVAAYFASRNPYPPLYPALLGVFGVADNILAARQTTTLFLLLAFLAYFVWLRALSFPILLASMLVLVFAILPGTYHQALLLLSENLYLALSLGILAAVAVSERSGERRWLWLAAVGVAACALTRSAGWTLVAAFLVYLAMHRPGRYPWIAVCAVAPVLLWQLFGASESGTYLGSFAERYRHKELPELLAQLAQFAAGIGYGWIKSFTTFPAVSPLPMLAAVLGVAGMLWRAWCLKLDGIYALLYVGLVLVWPYPAEARRLLFVIVPVLLAQGAWLLRALPRPVFSRIPLNYAHVFGVTLLIGVLPDLVTTVRRATTPLPPHLAPLRSMSDWYAADARLANKEALSGYLIIESLKQARAIVPPGECVYSIKPSIVAYYLDRVSYAPPQKSLDDDAFHAQLREKGCRFLFAINGSSPTFPTAFYPMDRLRVYPEIRIVSRLGGESGTIESILAELPRP